MRILMHMIAVSVFIFSSIAGADHKFYSKADVSACFGNLGCKALEILPFDQVPLTEEERKSDIHQWAPVSGSATGHDSVIEIRFKLDPESMNTFLYRRTDRKGAFSWSGNVTKPKGSYDWYAIDLKTGKRSKSSAYSVTQ